MATSFSSPLHMTIAVPDRVSPASQRPGFFSRLMAALVASRMKAAEREIARYRALHAELNAVPGKDALPF